eukprot:TRINITY_DN2998_c1_g1_i1.p2 TRINITY_DN2998_c1_g1~~TRINITY_DN2998_c1_g1_i1.p2  ORF type:complete len:326 (+),score=162.08 TRINITY_DN2998_c1_g1_i1:184-1161(+)
MASVSVAELERLRSLGRIAHERDMRQFRGGPRRDGDSDDESVTGSDSDIETAAELKAIGMIRTGKDSRTVEDRAGLEAAREAIRLKVPRTGAEVQWIETLVVPSGAPIVLEDAHDDLAREMAFYNAALAATAEARARLEKIGVPYDRPGDYYAEMVKTDEHMARVRQKLTAEKTAIEEAEARRRLKDAKKFGKRVQVEKQLERHKEKREALEGIKKWTKGRKRGADGATEEDLERMLTGKGGAPNAKRARKDDKYGFGGKKRGAKRNDATSSRDVSGFSLRKNREGTGAAAFRGKGKGKGKGAAGAKPGAAQARPGKARRQQMRR